LPDLKSPTRYSDDIVKTLPDELSSIIGVQINEQRAQQLVESCVYDILEMQDDWSYLK